MAKKSMNVVKDLEGNYYAVFDGKTHKLGSRLGSYDFSKNLCQLLDASPVNIVINLRSSKTREYFSISGIQLGEVNGILVERAKVETNVDYRGCGLA